MKIIHKNKINKMKKSNKDYLVIDDVTITIDNKTNKLIFIIPGLYTGNSLEKFKKDNKDKIEKFKNKFIKK